MISNNRTILFLIGCIGSRTLLAWLASVVNTRYLYFMGLLSLIPAIGFTIIYIFGLRKTGPEVFGETIWWNNLRPIHAFLYFGFAWYAIHGYRYSAWKWLAFDVIIGLVSFLLYHYGKKMIQFNK